MMDHKLLLVLAASFGSGFKVLASLSKKGLISKEKSYDRSRKVTISLSKNRASGASDNGSKFGKWFNI